jgi:hypothetical protein
VFFYYIYLMFPVYLKCFMLPNKIWIHLKSRILTKCKYNFFMVGLWIRFNNKRIFQRISVFSPNSNYYPIIFNTATHYHTSYRNFLQVFLLSTEYLNIWKDKALSFLIVLLIWVFWGKMVIFNFVFSNDIARVEVYY